MGKNEAAGGTDEHESTDEDANEDPNEVRFTRAQAAKRLRVSYATIARREACGELTPVKIKGVNYFTESDLAKYDEAYTGADGMGAGDIPAAQLLRASKDIIREQMKHNAEILNMSARVAFQLLELQSQTTIAQRERISALEREREALREKVEAAATTQHDRELELLREDAKLKMQAEGFAVLKHHAPMLLAPLAAKLAALGGGEPTGAAALEFAASLTNDQIVAVCQLGILTPPQLASLASIVSMRSAPPPGAPHGPGTNGAPPAS